MAVRIIAGVGYKSAFRSECPKCLCARDCVANRLYFCLYVCVCKRKIEKMRTCVCVSVCVCVCTPERAHGNGSST